MSSSCLLTEPDGPPSVRALACCYADVWGGILAWSLQLRDQGKSPGPLLHLVFPPCHVFEALTWPTLHQITATSCRVSFLLRCEWNQSFCLAAFGELVEISYQAISLNCQRGTLCSWERTPLCSIWSLFVSFQVVGCEKGLMRIPRYPTRHSLLQAFLSREAGTTPIVHSLDGVFPCFHANRSSLRYL